MVDIEIKEGFVDSLGREWARGRTYEVTEPTGNEFVTANLARLVLSENEELVNGLASNNAGLVVTSETSSDLVKIAKAKKLLIKRQYGHRKDNGGGSD